MTDLRNKKPELLLPAGSIEVLREAVLYGADAVYIGGETMSLRSKAKNATIEELKECVAFAHAHGVRVYVTANILAHNEDLVEARRYFEELKEVRPDALIISDPGVFVIAREVLPETEIHVSTQANNVNYETFLFWHRLGAKRVVAGRELSLKELAEIREKIPPELEIEAFVHGAMCISYSGRCLLSNYLTGRDANHGECTHPCRWKYALMEETRPGEYFPVEENERGTFIMNSKDLSMIGHVPELVAAGIDSFKVEGRMKTALYVATVARTYRRAIDDYFASPKLYEERLPWYLEEIEKVTFREYTTGFYFGKPGADAQVYEGRSYVTNYVYLGWVERIAPDGSAVFTQKNKFLPGDEIEIMKPDGTNVKTTVLEIRNQAGELMEAASHASEKLFVRFSVIPDEGNILRVRSRENGGGSAF